MKEKSYILYLFLFHCFLQVYKSITCPATGYVTLIYGAQGYCAKCDTTCKTCSNEGMNNCIDCPSDFTFNSNTSYCIPPATTQINTLQSSYKFIGFSPVTGWNGGYAYTDPTYGPTIYRRTIGQTELYKVFTLNPAHYQLRILVSLWILDPAATNTDWVEINFYVSGSTSTYKTITTSNLDAAGVATASGYQIYPTGWRAKNIDSTFTDSYHDTAKISFTSNVVAFGIREFIFIQYLCNQTACSRCDGSTNSSCLECTASTTRAITAAYPKQCLCDSSVHYFAHPDYDYCVQPCPNRLNGQYYGDPKTKNCVLSCSDTTYYADPATGQCATTCSATISLGSINRNLYYDTRNMKCVTICPDTEPYFNAADRKCYSTCPGGKFKNDQNMQCVTDCPDTGLIPLFGENGKCVEECIGADNWADFNTHRCTSTCSNDASSRKFFQDNSTRRNLCVRVCPFPEYFGDDITDPSQPYCDQICPDGYYGDYLDPRHCVAQCTQGSANYYGLKVDSRECVKVCPQNSWGQTTYHTCVLTAAQCKLDSNKYADNHTWTCVAKGTCSKGRYSYDTTQSCVITCPTGTYANDLTMHCETGCTGLYFADSGINKCVQVCQTQDYYADVSSGNKCVTACNQAGATPFRDSTTKTCVNICPISKKLFADSLAQSCVYNCTPGTYAYDNVPTDNNKTCVSICPGVYFADNSTGYGLCVLKCPQDPILFGDVVGVNRLCVSVCQATKFGDQDPLGGRLCVSTCTLGWFAQNDNLRRCVTRCNSTTYGYNLVCLTPQNCPTDWVGNPATNLCTSLCPASQGTFSDFNSKLCLSQCPIVGIVKYFADPTLRWCVSTCNASHNLFGNNKTLTCETKCKDSNAYADAQHPNRFCIEWCTDVGLLQYYRNNYTKTCVISTDCPDDYFADNNTQTCVAKCPIINVNQQTWGHFATQTCVTQCYGSLWGDASTGIPLCISQCPSVPAKWSYNGDMTCKTICPSPLYGQDFARTCVSNCPNVTDPGIPYQTFAYDGTRRCPPSCPEGTFSDYTTGKCYPTPGQCTFGWGDDYNNSCVYKCTGPTPWDTFGDDATHLCTILCTNGTFADSFTGTRKCVTTCPGTYDQYGNVTNVTGLYDSFGDDTNNRCMTFCSTPGYFADWQTHQCEPRCSGDDAVHDKPTYANNVNKRCVISLACPITPDKLYGDNRTRTCLTKCYLDATVTEWADNLTRACIPQCYHINDTAVYAYDTRFYGDSSTGIPKCLIICPNVPRLFGQNDTNKCVSECPDHQYGDQVNNRSCTADCYQKDGVIYYSQLTQRLCVDYCEDGTFANWHNRHCQTVPTDCPATEYGNDGNNSCVALCPEDMNYFGDPSTKLCVAICPHILTAVVNVTASINQQPGYTYADYSTRLCVRTCPASNGLHGTFGDNFTATCVARCPLGSYGDPLQANRRCVATCTNQNFADSLSMLCVSKCPASPPYFGYKGDWTCVKSCPVTLWADSSTRQCTATCPGGSYRLTSFRRQCVNICPSNPDLYSDTDSGNCQSICTLGKFADPTDRICKTNCLPLFQYNFRCIALCPNGYYANSTGDCVIPAECDYIVPFAQNRTTKCVATCTGGSFADPNSQYCIAICPDGWFGDGNVCTQTCLTPSTSASNITQTCVSTCPNLTYHQNNLCKNQCQTGYANDALGSCHTSCPLTPIKLFANPLNHDCDETCPSEYFRDDSTGFCVLKVNGCSGGLFSDQVKGNCVAKCSPGYWGNLQNHTCLTYCVAGQYGYESLTERTCHQPLSLPGTAPQLYADPQSKQFIAVCQTTPKLYFADTILQQCVQVCATHSLTEYYGDPQSRKCQSSCTNGTFYTADPLKDKCVLKCTYGTFRFNNTGDPICKSICPEGFADSSTRICIAQCPINADTYGYHNIATTERICVNPCPFGFYADPDTRECNSICISPYFADNTTHLCVYYCVDSFADQNNRKCMDKCYSNGYPSADNSTNQCVLTCPTSPDYYNQNHICVFYCTQTGYFADPSTRQCVSRCPDVAEATPYISYGDQTTGRCVKKCPQTYWGDNSTNKCVKTCPINSYADNNTRLCVILCPKNQKLYADPFLHICAYTCSHGWFGSQVTQQCIQTCQNGATQAQKYWGDPLTTLCTNKCPSSIYSYGQNITRKCGSTCNPHVTYGFADNFSRICRDKCQDTIVPETYADPTTSYCVEICPMGYFAQNTTNQCVQVCITGYADNFSRYCVAQCPDDPQSYGEVNANGDKICVYECLGGKFSNNDTNLCDVKCPTVPDFFGDPNLGRCVYFCTEGTYAQNGTRQCLAQCPDGAGYADNLTRKCVQFCPTASQDTYRDTTTQKCVRVCPDFWWAQNTSQICVNDCPQYANLTQSYEDNISKYCVGMCPFPYYGKNDTHQCVLECSALRLLYGHDEGRVCVTLNDCFPVGLKIYYADPVTGTCVQVCPQTLWADDITFTCVNDCDPIVKHQYRNINNQKCVLLCPSDPDEYADDISGNCVSKCPNGYYAHFYTGFRKCVSSCQPYGLFADNTTNRCVSACPTDPFMYADINTYKCVLQCSDYSYFADNKTQTCVQTCPAQWQLWGETIHYSCVQLCPQNYYADVLDNRKCNLQCTSPRFADKWTSTCVVHCSDIREYYFEDTSTGNRVCVQQCPGDSYGYNLDQTCKYKNIDASSSCPDPYYADRNSRLCVKLCPNGTYADDTTQYCQVRCTGVQFADNATRKCQSQCSGNYFSLVVSATNNTCVSFCPSPYYAQNSSHSCVQLCSTLYRLETTRSCESYCPQPYFKFTDSLQCRRNCTPLLADRTLRQCLTQCSSPDFGNPLTKTCDTLCPEGYYGRPNGRICSTSCEQGTFADPSTRLCVTSCPEYPLLYADDDTNQCVQFCQNGFGYQKNRTCISSCPNDTFIDSHSVTINLIYLADSSNHFCVLQCINADISFADYSNNQCTQRCPDATFANNFTKECVNQCPTTPNNTFAQNNSNICVQKCPTGAFGDSQTLYCVSDCTLPTFQDQTTNLCVQTCPEGFFAQTQTATCVRNCQANTYADSTTRRCVAICPLMHELFKYDENWTCVTQCPPTFYADDTQRKCKNLCAQTGMYAYELTRECVRQCPVPYRGYDQNHTCILTCPALYFYNITRNKCTKCPASCLVCTSPTSCLRCAPGFNLFNGICDISCQPSNGIITYSDPTGVCVRICPYTYYGDNSSYACVHVCPLKQFGSNNTQFCQNCPETCAACSSPSNCSLCESIATLAIDNMCYKDCNSTHKYYYNNTCYNICPDATYLTYTNVHCGACSTNCLTCNQTATKCLSCKGKYFYQDACLITCPNNYFGNTDFICQECLTNATACSKPLNFTTQVIKQNFQYVILLKFNQNVNIDKQIQDILKIKLKVQRRMLESSMPHLQHNQRLLGITDLINNGIQYTYEILSDGTIKLYLTIDVNLVNPEFTIEFTDPTAIKSIQGGGTLQTSQSNFVLQKVQYYSPQAGVKSQTNVASRFAVIFILLLYALSFFWTDAAVKPIQLIQIALMHATLNIAIPPSLYFYLLQFKRSLLSFTPNFFLSALEKDKTYHTSTLKVIDIFVDADFLRNLGQIFFFIIVLSCMWFVFGLLSNKRLISDKLWHNMFDDVFKRRFKFTAINDVISLFYVPILWFAFTQFKDLTGEAQKSYSNLNAAFTIIFLVIALLLPIVWLFVWYKFQQNKFEQQCTFMCKRVKKIELTYQIYSQTGQSDQKMKSQKQGQVAMINTVSTGIKNSKHQLQTIVNYLYMLLINIWLVGLYDNVLAQLSMLLVTNIVYMIYVVYFRPFINIINTIITPIVTLTLVLIQSYMIYFFLNEKNMFADQKTELAKPLLYALSVLYVIMILWTIWRVVYDAMDILNYFKKTEFYLVFGDPEHIVEKQVSEIYQKFEKKAENVQYQLGDQIVQKIYRQVNQNGQSVIKVKKKVLVKKKKESGRKRKMKRQENYQDNNSQSNSEQQEKQKLTSNNNQLGISSKDSKFQVQEQYIRVNKPTPFQMTKIIDEEIKISQNGRKKAKTNFKAIDDDLREDSDEDQEDDYINNEKSPRKQNKKLTKKGKSDIDQQQDYYSKRNNIKKIIVQVEEQDQSIHGIDDIFEDKSHKQNKYEELQSNNQSEIKMQIQSKISSQQQPFEFISDINEEQTLRKSQKQQIPQDFSKKDEMLSEKEPQKYSEYKLQDDYKELQSQKQSQKQEDQIKSKKQNNQNEESQNISELHLSQLENYKNDNQLLFIKRAIHENLGKQRGQQINGQKQNQNIFDTTSKKPVADLKIFDLEQLLQEEEQNKNNKLMFLFDDEEEDI